MTSNAPIPMTAKRENLADFTDGRKVSTVQITWLYWYVLYISAMLFIRRVSYT